MIAESENSEKRMSLSTKTLIVNIYNKTRKKDKTSKKQVWLPYANMVRELEEVNSVVQFWKKKKIFFPDPQAASL